MELIENVRRDRIRLLISEAGSQARLAASLGKKQPQISQWMSSSAHARASQRTVSSRSARQIEKALGKPLGWMDQPLNEGERRAAESFVPPIGRPVRQPAGEQP